MEEFIQISHKNIDSEHICCAFSDKKCTEGYQLKKEWLKQAFDDGYVFRRLDARAKVFIEYGPAEKAWLPIDAPGYLNINCFWVSGKYKQHGYGKALLQSVLDDAKAQGKHGLVTVVGTKKFHFMSDTKWLLRQGFESVEELPSGFSLLALNINADAPKPAFKKHLYKTSIPRDGLVAYYSNRCPFTEYHVHTSLTETAEKRKLPLTIVKLDTLEKAQKAPTPATLFSLFYEGQFISTDVSVCMDSRHDKIVQKALKK